MADPDMGVWRYYYDTNGNLMMQNDSRGQLIHLGYDPLNRILTKNSTDVNITFGYDQEYDGTLSNISNYNTNISYHYDQRLRVINETKRIESVNFENLYAYDSQNRLILKEGLGEIDQIYNLQGKVQKVPGYVNDSGYSAFGSVLNRTLGNGLIQTFTYNAQNNRLTSIAIPNVQSLNYTYDNVGNILVINDQINARLHSMAYDDLNRLTSANISGTFYKYSYDSLGRMLKIVTNNQSKKFTYNNLTHAPSQIVDGAAGVDVYKPQELISRNRTRTYEVYLVNDGNTSITGVNLSVQFGDGQTYTNTSLTIESYTRVVFTNNFSQGGDYRVNVTAVSANINDSQIVHSRFGIRAQNMSRLYANASINTFEFKVHNDINLTAFGANWNCTDGITSLYVANVTANQTLYDYIQLNYTSSGSKTFACTVTSQDGNESKFITFTVPGLEVQNYDVMHQNISSRIIGYDVRNRFTQAVTNISMVSGDTAFSRNTSITNNERVWVFAQLNYTTDGIKDFSIGLTANNVTEAYREEFSRKGAIVENYQRIDSNTTKRILLFDIRNRWQEGNVSWNISEPALSQNNFIGNNKTIMVMIEQNYTSQGDKEPSIQTRVSSYVDVIKDFFEVRPIQIRSLSTLEEGTTTVSEMVVQNTLNQTQTFSWQFDSGKDNLSSTQPISLNTSSIFVYIASNHTSNNVWRTFARVNTTLANDTARGVVVS